jgi:hypothetical protein
MNPPFESQLLARDYALDPMAVAKEIKEVSGSRLVDTALGSKEIPSVLTRALANSGLLSKDSQAVYDTFVAAGGGEEYDDIVADGLSFIRDVNDDSHKHHVAK